jgi:hypothetical protein
MRLSLHSLRFRAALFGLSLSILCGAFAPLATSQPAPNPFNDQRFLASPTPTPTASAVFQEQPAAKKPIPRSLKIAIVVALILIALVVLAFAVRAWHAGNLFDREYHFPAVTSVALRLGAKRSGGCMATLTFRNREETSPQSGRENS